jgi:hypothetical protein
MEPADLFDPSQIRAHREAAIRYLRDLVEDEDARPGDRAAAARDLAKLINDLPAESREERKAHELSDDELLTVIHDARARREAASSPAGTGATLPPSGVGGGLAQKGPVPESAAGSPGADAPVFQDDEDSFAAALADVADLPNHDLWS